MDDRVYDQLVAMGIPLANAREAITRAMQEVTPDDVKPPDFGFDPPGHGFFWHSEYFQCHMYLKVRLEDARPRCKLYSLHEPVYSRTTQRAMKKVSIAGKGPRR